MKRYLLTWAIEDRHGATTFFSEAILTDDWERHVAATISRQTEDASGRFIAPWRLVFMAELATNQIADALE